MLGALLGASTGSFIMVVIERVPKNESISKRSHCVCGTMIPMYRNIPLISYILQRGSSHCCNTAIPFRYFVYELVFAAIGGVFVLFFGYILGIALIFLVAFATTGSALLTTPKSPHSY